MNIVENKFYDDKRCHVRNVFIEDNMLKIEFCDNDDITKPYVPESLQLHPIHRCDLILNDTRYNNLCVHLNENNHVCLLPIELPDKTPVNNFKIEFKRANKKAV